MIEYALTVALIIVILLLVNRKAEHGKVATRFGNLLSAMTQPRWGTLGYGIAHTE